jgi:hypothetical protein
LPLTRPNTGDIIAASHVDQLVDLYSGGQIYDAVQSYGADPTGASDSYTAIQNALNAVPAAGGLVYLKPGVYLLSHYLTLKRGTYLKGAGMFNTILRCTTGFLTTQGPDGGWPTILIRNVDECIVEDLQVDGNVGLLGDPGAARTNAYHVDVRMSHRTHINRVAVRNRWTYAITFVGNASTATDQFLCTGCDINVTTSGVLTSGGGAQLDGIHCLDASGGRVIGNKVDNRIGTDGDDALVVHTINADAHDIVFANNEVRGGYQGCNFQFAGGTHLIYGIVVANNVMWGGYRGIQMNWFGAPNPAGQMRDIVVTGNLVRDTNEHGFNIINAGTGPSVANLNVTGNVFVRCGLTPIQLDVTPTNYSTAGNITS